MASILSRYGHSEQISDPNDSLLTKRMLAELRTEQIDEPDDEHTQVAVSNDHWAVTAQASGLVTFDNLDLLEGVDSDLPETMYLRDVPDDQLIAIWQTVVRADRAALLTFPWRPLDQLSPYVRDYYRSGEPK